MKSAVVVERFSNKAPTLITSAHVRDLGNVLPVLWRRRNTYGRRKKDSGLLVPLPQVLR